MGRCRHRMFIIMKHYYLSFFIATLMSMACNMASAHDIAVANSDGKTIFYDYNSDVTSVSVTYKGNSRDDYYGEYTGDIVIPETVTYSGQTYSVTSIGSSAFYDCGGLTSVTIPNSVTSISSSAFKNCSGLTSVTIPNSVTSIGDYAFDDCGILTSVTIPNSVTSIGKDAFYRCSRLKSVAIGNSVTSIGSSAFYACWGLTSVTIPNSVTSIGDYAFYRCSGLTSVTIPNSVTSIGDYAFDDCLSLKKVIVPNIDLKNWCSIKFGNYYANPLYYAHHLYSDENTEITKLVIPNDVTNINSYAFYGCSGLTSVTIPNSVTSIGDYAFDGCWGLTSITWNAKNCSASSSYSYSPFYSIRTRIKEFIIGDDLTSIPSYMCYGMSNLESVTIPNSVTSIGSYAFYNTRIKSLTIGTGIQTIASDAFSYSTYYDDPNGAKPIKVIWLANTPPSGYKDVGGTVNYVPNDSYSGLSGQKIYPFLSSMFEVDGIKYVPVSPSERTCDAIDCVYNESAENTKIGNTVTYKNINMTVQNVGNSICEDNTFIKELEFSYNGGILSKIFSGCSNITSVTWNAKNYPGISSGSSNPFYYIRTQITEFIIGDVLTSIPKYMCYGMSNLKSVTIPNSVTSIGSDAFNGCSGLQKVIVPNINIKNWCSIKFGNYSANPLYYAHHLYSDENTEITKLVIPNDVTSINSYAFYGCSGLTSVTIPNSVTTIGSSAFNGCSGLEKVIVPDIKNWCSIKFGGYNANPLYYAHHLYSDENTEIKKLVISDGVTTIGSYAFDGCSGLTSVVIPNSVTSIGSAAFSGCSGLTSVTIPNSVTTIGSSAFSNCSGLTKVIVPDIKNWCSITFANSTDNPLYYAHHLYSDENTEITELVIPDGVTRIGSSAFKGCSGLTSVTIPNSVTSITSSAFEGCSGLTSVTIGNSVTYIGTSAFEGCSGLTSVTIGNSVTSIGSYAFYNCSLKKVIVPDIKNWCSIKFGSSTDNPLSFAHHLYSDENTEITKLVIPNDVTSIGRYAFYGCSGLTSVTIGNSVTSIGSSAFKGCSGLTSVTIGNSVTSIGSDAFYGCSGLTSVTIPNSVTSIGSYAFSGCSGLTSVTIPNSVTSIGSYAFSGCSGLTSVTIPNSVTSIGSSAFSGCSGLTSVTIGNSVTSIGSSAFSGCSGLKSITWNAKNYPAFSSYSSNPFYNIRNQITEFVIGDDMTSIPSYMCYEMSNLKSVIIPNSVTNIGSSAFSGCSGLEKVIVPNFDIKNWCNIKFASSTDNPLSFAHHLYSDENTEITKLVIPNDVTSINSYAFYGCSGLTSVTIPNSVTSIGYDAFYGCSGLKKVIVPDIKNWCSIKFGDSTANPLYYAHHLYSDENTEITKLVIPDGVTSIGSYAFEGCSGLTSVTIPNSVTSIGSSAFSGCSGLTSVTIGNSVTSIGSTIFSGCSSLTSVRFENSKDNTPIVLENNKVFSDCTLDEVYIGRKLSYTKTSSAGYSPFYRNTTLRSVKFTDKETEISDYEFYGCTNLTDVSMGDGVKSIGAYAFSRCSSLEHFTCGRQLKSIGKEAFSDCTSMTKFRTRAAVPPTCGAQALDDINKWECTLYVPTESIDDYQAADQWKNFFFIEKFNLQGDSNGDDVVNAKDYSGVASYIMGETPEAFDAEASDVDENGDIDVRDYVGIANIISAGSIYGGTSNNAKAAMSKGAAMPATDESDAENVIYVENVSGSKNSQVELSVRMRNASDIRGFQFDLYLPEGVSMATNAKASLSSDRLAAGDAHTLMVDEVSDGAVRFLCSSMNDENFAGGDGEIATLTVNIADNVVNGDYDVVVKNALMTETDISKSYEADNIKSTLTVLDQTGVETVTADNERRDGSIYTVGGQLVGKKSTTSQLRKGIYIRNGRKIVVK